MNMQFEARKASHINEITLFFWIKSYNYKFFFLLILLD